MKKKLISIMLTAAMVISFAGCITKSTDTSNKGISPEEYGKTIETNAKVYKKYIKLPEYTGIEAEVDKSVLNVTDEDVEEYVDSILQSYATTEEVKTGVTANGDSIILDYSGKLNGVAFSGGTATDATYTIGSKRFIEDLDKGLEGLTVGKKYEIPCKFPDDYGNAELDGKEVIFEVTVSAINKTVIPELTDEWVAENAEDLNLEDKTVEGLRKAARDYLTAKAESEFSTTKFTSAMEKIIEQITVKEYPKKELEFLKKTWKTNVESEYENSKAYYEQYGISDFSAFLSEVYNCADDAAFDDLARKNAEQYLLEKMVMTIIAYDNKLTVSADEIKSLGEEYAKYYELESYDAILKEFGNVLNAELGYGVLSEKVMNFINEKSVEVDAPTEAETESENASETESTTAAN